MTLTNAPRSVRNNNPGNIERSGIAWLGLAEDQTADPRFCVFAAPQWGFRALALDLHSKWREGLVTVARIVAKYAPPEDNDTAAYIKSVCHEMGVAPDAPLDLENPLQLAALCRAIAAQESGGWFFDNADLDTGVALALRSGDASAVG
jgi:hypothetical protein